jgi:hypothetical protein
MHLSFVLGENLNSTEKLKVILIWRTSMIEFGVLQFSECGRSLFWNPPKLPCSRFSNMRIVLGPKTSGASSIGKRTSHLEMSTDLTEISAPRSCSIQVEKILMFAGLLKTPENVQDKEYDPGSCHFQFCAPQNGPVCNVGPLENLQITVRLSLCFRESGTITRDNELGGCLHIG